MAQENAYIDENYGKTLLGVDVTSDERRRLKLSSNGRVLIASEYGTTTTAINGTVFDDDPTTETSAEIDTTGYGNLNIDIDVLSTLTPTDLEIKILSSQTSGGTFRPVAHSPIWFEDTGTASPGASVVYQLLNVGAPYVKVKVTCTGTGATNKFTVTIAITPFN